MVSDRVETKVIPSRARILHWMYKRYPRNGQFIGRKSLLDALDVQVKANREQITGSVPVVLYGMGGVGKSQIANQYRYLHFKEYDYLFWISASSLKTLYSGFRSAAQEVISERVRSMTTPDYDLIAKDFGIMGAVDGNGSLSGDEAYNEMIVDGMKRWFAKYNRWLLILDQVDDLESFKVVNFIPQVVHGTIIMTSRRTACTMFGTGLMVPEMLESEGVELLLRSATRDLRGKFPSKRWFYRFAC